MTATKKSNYFERCDECGHIHIWFGTPDDRPDCELPQEGDA